MPRRSPTALLALATLVVAAVSSTSARAEDAPPAAEARPSGPRARVIAALPFGAGQFQNGDVALGAFFAAGQVVLGGVSIATALLVSALASRDVSRRPVDVAALNDRLRTTATVNRLAFAGWASLAVAGVIEAQVSLTPQRAPVTAAAAQ